MHKNAKLFPSPNDVQWYILQSLTLDLSWFDEKFNL